MKLIYALVAACLSLQACNNQPPSASTSANEYSTAEYMAADLYVDEYNVGTITQPAVKPIDRGAKSYDDDYAMWTTLPAAEYSIDATTGHDHTATVTSPAGEPSDEKLGTAAPELYFDDDGFDFKLPAPIDQHAIQATDWW